MTSSPPALTDARRAPFPRWVVLGSWAVYDLANTIFSAIVVTRYFVDFMVDRGMGRLWLAGANITSMFAAGLVSPHAGAAQDRWGYGRVLLGGATLACVLATAALALPAGNWTLLFAFALANFFYNLALVFYNAFLPHIASSREQGRVSGLGTGVGYMGVIPALYLAGWIHSRTSEVPPVFVMAANLFLLLAVPALITLPRLRPTGARLGNQPFRDLLRSARRIWADRQTRLYFLGNLLCTDVLNALIFYMADYVGKVFQFDEKQKTNYFALLTVSNITCSFVVGWLCDRFTARKAFLLSAACLLAALLVASLTPVEAILPLVCATVPLAGFALGGLWTAGRKLLFEITPPERLGEFSGFYGFTGKVSSFTTLIYAAVTSWGTQPGLPQGGAHRAALLIMTLPVLAGLVLIARMREPVEEGAAPAEPLEATGGALGGC